MYGPSRDPRTVWYELVRDSRGSGEKIFNEKIVRGSLGPKDSFKEFPPGLYPLIVVNQNSV